jgi:hypothetical protein
MLLGIMSSLFESGQGEPSSTLIFSPSQLKRPYYTL